jgi:hypothetical protein
MSDDTEAAALRAQLEAIIKEAEDAEAQVATVRHCVQAACLLVAAEEPKTTALQQTTTAARQHVPSSPSSASSPTARPHRAHHRTSPSGGRGAQCSPASEHRPRLLLHQLRLLS